MKTKRIVSSFLLMTFLSLFATPLTGEAQVGTEQETLYDFLKSTKNIEASYSYPSMKLAAATTGGSTLAAHTPIVIRCTDTITTRDIVSGGTVDFAVVSDIKDANGKVLVKAGTPATAQITFSKPRGRIGQSGEVTVSDFHTTAVDGTYVPLSGSVSARPDDKMVLSVCLGILICPLFLLMRGEDAQLPAGTTKTVYTVTSTQIKAVNL